MGIGLKMVRNGYTVGMDLDIAEVSYSSVLILPFLISDQKTLRHLPIERLAKHPHLEEHRFDKLGN
jgi:hypothetical protein